MQTVLRRSSRSITSMTRSIRTSISSTSVRYPYTQSQCAMSNVYNTASVVPDSAAMPKLDLDIIDTTDSVVRSVLPNGIVRMTGVPEAKLHGLVNIYSTVPGVGRVQALVLRLLEREVHAALLVDGSKINEGDRVTVATGEQEYPSFPLTPDTLGRIVSGVGKPLDTLGPLKGPNNLQPVNSYILKQITPPISKQLQEGQWITTGIKAIDLFAPIRRGLKIGIQEGAHDVQKQLVFSVLNSTLSQNALTNTRAFSNSMLQYINPQVYSEVSRLIGQTHNTDMLVKPRDGDLNTCVWVCLNKSSTYASELRSELQKHNLHEATAIIASDYTTTPIAQHLAVLHGVVYANYLRMQGHHVTLVVDDVSAHYDALTALYRTNTDPHPFQLASIQAEVFNSVINVGDSSITGLFMNVPRTYEIGPKTKKYDIWKQGFVGLCDHTITLSPNLSQMNVWPALPLDKLNATIKFQPPVLAKLAQRLLHKLYESTEAEQRLKMGQELGVSLDWDVVEVVEWKSKLQVMMSQEPSEFIPLHFQYLSLFSLIHPRLLAGVEIEQVHEFDTFLREEAMAHPNILQRLRDQVNFGSIVDTRGRLLAQRLGDHDITPDLEQDLLTLVDDALTKFLTL